jgi:hypothetical protein
MKHRFFATGAFVTVILASQFLVFAQTGDGEIAKMVAGAGGIRWEIGVAHAGGTLTITFPDGRAVRRSVRAGAAAEINLSDKYMDALPDGTYSYELRLAAVISSGQKEAILKARGNDDDSESDRLGRKRSTNPQLTQSGSFAIVNGSIVGPGAVEGQRTNAKAAPQPRAPLSGNTVSRLRNHRTFMGAPPDQVIPDDLIVQGSACVGLDCVNNENFGFDTIRMKENNTRLHFDDTSVSTGFPTNNWQIRANSSSSGGENFLGFVDQGSTGNSETGTVVFLVNAGAPANSVKVANTGKVGFRTSTPVLDLHMNTGDTPAVRFEQNIGGGFGAQTWDIGANEANFFVRDVTSGSRLPLRIRPGAPTSSLDISATGNVGIGTGTPGAKLHVFGSETSDAAGSFGTNPATGPALNFGYSGATFGRGSGFFNARPDASAIAPNPSIRFMTVDVERMIITNQGRVGIGTTAPDQVLSVNGDASKVGGGSWQTFSDERLKQIRGRFNRGLSAVLRLQPLRYEYKSDNALGLKSDGERIGFGAQSLRQVIPEAVTRNADGYLMVNNDPIIWTMLNAIKEQQKEIEELKGQIRKLQADRTRARRK